MAQKTKNNLPSPDASAEVVTHIGSGTRVVGRLSGQEDIRVHGTVEGVVRLGAALFVEPEGVVLAEVWAHDVVVSGTVVGNIHAENAVVLTATARVVGDLRSPRISLEPGAAFRGAISMDPPDVEALEAEASASRGYGASRSAAAPTVRGAISERQAPANGETRRAQAPARTQQSSVRLPPRRAQAFTAAPTRAPEPRVWAREPVRPAQRLPAAPVAFQPAPFQPSSFQPAEDDTIIVQHAAIRSSDDRPRRRTEALPSDLAAERTSDLAVGAGDEPRKKLARPKTLARGKHKVERVD